MNNPAAALLAFFIVVVTAAVFLSPRWGMVARLKRLASLSERVRMEDSLKHLFNCEYEGRPCTLASLAGALEVSRGAVVRLVARLEARGLLRSGAGGPELTRAGRTYALRIVRSHRLWERYLADRTGLRPADWHARAELKEHRLSPEETEDLAARMGHPLYDPHGDPIPTANGDIPPRRGVPLTALQPGQAASIVHLEDEPAEVYEELVNEGLTPMMGIEVLDKTRGEIRFRADGTELQLPPVVASNVSVSEVRPAEGHHAPLATLADLEPGEEGTVAQLAPACAGPQRRRLLDLGVVPGTRIQAEFASASRDPIAYRIRGALIALRKQQAVWIQIQRTPAETN